MIDYQRCTLPLRVITLFSLFEFDIDLAFIPTQTIYVQAIFQKLIF